MDVTDSNMVKSVLSHCGPEPHRLKRGLPKATWPGYPLAQIVYVQAVHEWSLLGLCRWTMSWSIVTADRHHDGEPIRLNTVAYARDVMCQSSMIWSHFSSQITQCLVAKLWRLEKMYSEAAASLCEILSLAEKVAITTDAWTALTTESLFFFLQSAILQPRQYQ